jgi:hypothetical protein
VAVIVTVGVETSAAAAKAAIPTIPIVFNGCTVREPSPGFTAGAHLF